MKKKKVFVRIDEELWDKFIAQIGDTHGWDFRGARRKVPYGTISSTMEQLIAASL